MKFAAHIGNMHAAARVTPFFDSDAEVAQHAKANGIDYSFIKQISNWAEHQAWNKAKVGFYAERQINE